MKTSSFALTTIVLGLAAASLLAGSARAADLSAEPAAVVTSSSTTSRDATNRAPARAAVGVRFGVSHASLESSRLPKMSGFVDDWRETTNVVTPELRFGGDGYFFKLDFPMTRTETFTSYGLGIYPFNYGHLFRRSGLLPYASAGVVANVMTMPGQGIAGGMGQARGAIGMTVRVVGRLDVSFELGYSPWVGGLLVDKRKTVQLVQAAIDGMPAGVAGDRSARGGIGSALDFSIGVAWL
jgi:hypothetical protein